MCGIFGYIGNDAIQSCVKGLKKLEYRGYDSAGIATVKDGEFQCFKSVGPVTNLEETLPKSNLEIALGHTRWATHGKIDCNNAHPHSDQSNSIMLVHNGIIENHEALKKRLVKAGYSFSSETDTEILVQLIASYNRDPLEAMQLALKEVEGSLAIAMMHKDFPGQLFAMAYKSPIVIAFDKVNNKVQIASDPQAFEGKILDIIYLKKGEFAKIALNDIKIFKMVDGTLKPCFKKAVLWNVPDVETTLKDFDHFTLKEIYDQPEAIERNFTIFRQRNYQLPLDLTAEQIRDCDKIVFIACGSAYYVALLASYFLRLKIAKPVYSEVASEYRYNPSRNITAKTILIAISQSGETADTIATVEDALQSAAYTIAICNCPYSTLARMVDTTIAMNCGHEIGVCSTKAVTTPIVLTLFLATHIARLCGSTAKSWIDDIRKLPDQIATLLKDEHKIATIAAKYKNFSHFLFLGRQMGYPVALEAALKLKELSYIAAFGYFAGELKHGVIATVDENSPIIVFGCHEATNLKLKSNVIEAKTRGAPIIAVVSDSCTTFDNVVDDIIHIPQNGTEVSCVLAIVVSQLFAYHYALLHGHSIDKPRNLAKSVTVE